MVQRGLVCGWGMKRSGVGFCRIGESLYDEGVRFDDRILRYITCPGFVDEIKMYSGCLILDWGIRMGRRIFEIKENDTVMDLQA